MPSITFTALNQDPTIIDIPAGATAAEQTALIQSALDAVAEAGGGTVTLSAGTFEVTGTGDAADGALRVGSNTTLEGAGIGQTTIRLADGSTSVTGIVRTDSGGTLPDGSYKTTENVTIANLSIDGNQANTTGDVDGFYSGSRPDSGLRDTDITLDSVEIYNASRYGFDPHEGTTNLTITNSIAHHNGKDGFVIDGSEHVVLSDNIAYENGRHGINIVTGSRDVLVENNLSYDNGSSGLVIQTGDNEIRAWTSDVTIVGGSYDNNARYGIEAKQTADLTISDVAASGNNYHGIVLSGVVGADLDNNTLAGNNNGGSQLRLKNYVQDFDDAEVANDRVIVTSDVTVDGVVQSQPTNDLDVPAYDWSISPGDDSVTGTEIADVFALGDGDDYAFGAGGNDTLDGGAGDDLLLGNIGDDRLLGSAGFDTLDGGFGFDTADFSNLGSAVYVDLKYNGAQVLTSGGQSVSKNSATTPVAELIDIESVVGSAYADKMYGSNGADDLRGGEGNDVVKGRSGADVLAGDGGNDKLRGNGGADVIDGGSGDDDLRGGGGNDRLDGGTGDDFLHGGSGSDTFVFSGDWGSDRIDDFRRGQDKIAFEGPDGPASFDDLTLTAQGRDTLITFVDQEILVDNVAPTSLSESDFLLL